MADRYTVDELAHASGLNTSTIRLYRHRGLLPAPRMEGRVGYFDDGHVARLRLIAELRERGFSLAAIKDLVDTWESGRDLDEVLGMERALARPADVEPLSRGQLEQRFPELANDRDLWRRLDNMRVAMPRDDGDYDVSRGFLQTSAVLASLGIPLGVMLDEFEPVGEFARAQAERFVALFERYVLAAVDEVDPVALAKVIEALRAAGIDVVAAALAIAIDEAAADAVARHVPRP
jgi:DNA-binding transcriptional MerR regulator